MKEPLIVSARHGNRRLLDPECSRGFLKHVLWLLTPDTLLLMEGAHHETYYGKEHPEYAKMRYAAEDQLGVRLINSPTIGWRDKRYMTDQSNEEFAALHNYALRFILPRIILSAPMPKTMNALCTAFIHSPLAGELSGEAMDHGLHEHCIRQLEWYERFDEPMIGAARAWGKEERPTVIVCGGIHAFMLHRSTGWPILFLDDTPERVRSLTFVLIASVLCPEQVLGKTPIIAPQFTPAR